MHLPPLRIPDNRASGQDPWPAQFQRRLRLIVSAQVDNDARAAVLGMLVSVALAQSWDLAGTPAGTQIGGQIAVLAGLAKKPVTWEAE